MRIQTLVAKTTRLDLVLAARFIRAWPTPPVVQASWPPPRLLAVRRGDWLRHARRAIPGSVEVMLRICWIRGMPLGRRLRHRRRERVDSPNGVVWAPNPWKLGRATLSVAATGL